MFFLNQAKDAPLFQEIVREGVISSALWESLKLPADGHLMDVLVGYRTKIAEQPWVDWLIRKHNCTRIPSMEPDYTFIKAVNRQVLTECLKADCYPLRAGENHLFVGIGRPDYPEVVDALKQNFNKRIIYLNALTINEIHNIRDLCKEALQSM